MNNNTKAIVKFGGLCIILGANYSLAAPLALHQSPLFLTSSEKANVLVIMDNSNSMDEAINGAAVGSADPTSKSEIARHAVKNLITAYQGKINMGLMAYKQAPSQLYNIDNSFYDISFNPTTPQYYDPDFDGERDALTKRYRWEQPDNPGNYIYYNIALPYYHAGGSVGDVSYCYSLDNQEPIGDNSIVRAFNNGEVPPAYNPNNGNLIALNGPWNNYKCFEHKTGTSDVDLAEYSVATGDKAFIPADSDLAQGILDAGVLIASEQVGVVWFAPSSPGRGFLHTFIDELNAAQAAVLNTKLGVSQFVNNEPENIAYPLQNSGMTPLQGTLLSAKDYFDGGLPASEYVAPTVALPESCGKNFVALLTDGMPSVSSNGSAILSPATALNDVVAVATDLKNTAGVETYVVSFTLPVGVNPETLNAIANAGGTNAAYMADNPAALQSAFDSVFTDILEKTSASSSAATNSTSIAENSVIYQARFNSGNWSGQLLAKTISMDGVINNNYSWDASLQLAAKPAGSRTILTYGRDTNDGIPFRWNNIEPLTDTTAKDALNTNYFGDADANGQYRVDFLRGGTGSGALVPFRADRHGKLGDIIHSTPYYVGAPLAGYNDLDMADYFAFHTAKANRTPVIYAGANDGMLHGFNAASGEEVLAYIPREVFPNLSRLTAEGYGVDIAHQYYVDGSIAVADAYVNGNWKTVLAGGLNAGGQGVYALDVTNPSSFSEANAANIVLWEFTDEDDADLGYTYFNPVNNFMNNQSAQIAKMANGKWAVIIGNGYNNSEADGHASATGHAYLYILFIEGGTDGTWTLNTDYIKIDTGIGSVATPNGLATPMPVDKDGDGDVDLIYVGDLQGNLWKFDVSDPSAGRWGLAATNPSGKPLFTATDNSNNPQPITSIPLVTPHPNSGFMVSFGTGKYIEQSDIATTDPQTIYGIWDWGDGATVSGKASLVEQTVSDSQSRDGIDYRTNTAEPVSYQLNDRNGTSTDNNGWFVNLPDLGERVDVNPIMRDGRVVYVTRTPSAVACAAGGTSWLMEFDYLTGGRVDTSPFDVNNDAVINDADYVLVNGVKIPVTGRRDPTGGMLSTPTVLKDKLDQELKIMASSNGSISSVKESVNASYSGRLSWEELR